MKTTKKRDSSYKTIFGDPYFLALLLQRFTDIAALKNITPEDISDITERFVSLYRNELNSDTVKWVRLPDGLPLFIITLVEQQSIVDYGMAFRILRYIVAIYEWYYKEQRRLFEAGQAPSPDSKEFRFPVVLPIVFFDGDGAWTAVRDFHSLVDLSSELARFVPQFEYLLIDLSKVDAEELVATGDALSFMLLVDKLGAGMYKLMETHPDLYERARSGLTGSRAEILREVSETLLDYFNMSDADKDLILGDLNRGGSMFEKIRGRTIYDDVAELRREKADWQRREADLQHRVATLEAQLNQRQ
jgi:hypothetical protein